MKNIKLFCSTKQKSEQDINCLSLGQLQELVDNEQGNMDVISFKNEEDYLKAKSKLAKRYDLGKINQVLMVIENDTSVFKREREVSHA